MVTLFFSRADRNVGVLPDPMCHRTNFLAVNRQFLKTTQGRFVFLATVTGMGSEAVIIVFVCCVF